MKPRRTKHSDDSRLIPETMFQEKFSRTKYFVFEANSMGFNDQLGNLPGKFGNEVKGSKLSSKLHFRVSQFLAKWSYWYFWNPYSPLDIDRKVGGLIDIKIDKSRRILKFK
jgi:hypothetical protein